MVIFQDYAVLKEKCLQYQLEEIAGNVYSINLHDVCDINDAVTSAEIRCI